LFGENIFADVVGMTRVQTSLTHLGAGNQSNFTYTFVDTKGFAIAGCLEVNKITFQGEVNLCNVCTASSSATLVCSVNSTTSIIAIGTINDSGGQKIVVQTLSIEKIVPDASFGVLGAFLAFLLIFAIAAIGQSIEIVLIAGVIGIGVTAAMGLFAVAGGIVLGLAGSAVLIILLKRR